MSPLPYSLMNIHQTWLKWATRRELYNAMCTIILITTAMFYQVPFSFAVIDSFFLLALLNPCTCIGESSECDPQLCYLLSMNSSYTPKEEHIFTGQNTIAELLYIQSRLLMWGVVYKTSHFFLHGIEYWIHIILNMPQSSLIYTSIYSDESSLVSHSLSPALSCRNISIQNNRSCLNKSAEEFRFCRDLFADISCSIS